MVNTEVTAPKSELDRIADGDSKLSKGRKAALEKEVMR